MFAPHYQRDYVLRTSSSPSSRDAPVGSPARPRGNNFGYYFVGSFVEFESVGVLGGQEISIDNRDLLVSMSFIAILKLILIRALFLGYFGLI